MNDLKNHIFYVFDALDQQHRRSGIVEVTVPRIGYNGVLCRVRACTDIINHALSDRVKKTMYWHAAGDVFEVFRAQLKEIVY